MLVRLFSFFVLLALLATAVWARSPRLEPTTVLAKSDALYYYPVAQGVKDLAVDLTFDIPDGDPLAKTADMHFYFAGYDHQRFAITNLTDAQAETRDYLLSLVTPLADYIMPRPAADTFRDLNLSLKRLSRQLGGVKSTAFIQLIGAAKDKNAEIKEFHILLDEAGLAYQVENVMHNGSTLVANMENAPAEEHPGLWHVTRVTTRLFTNPNPIWKVDTVSYNTVNGFCMPSSITTLYRNNANQPVRQFQNQAGQMVTVLDSTVHFSNYRINQGAAAALFAQDEKK